MVRRRIGIFERNPIESHSVLSVRETAKEGLSLAQSDSVGIQAERARRIIHVFGVVGHRRHEIVDEVRTDFGFGRGRFEQVARGRCSRRQRNTLLHRDRLRQRFNGHGNGHVQCRTGGDQSAGARG